MNNTLTPTRTIRYKVVAYIDVSQPSPSIVRDVLKKQLDRVLDNASMLSKRRERLVSLTVTPDLSQY